MVPLQNSWDCARCYRVSCRCFDSADVRCGVNSSTDEFRRLLKKVESQLKENASHNIADNLWAASILNYQQGKFNDSLSYINELLSHDPNHIFGYYNLGIIAMKIPQKQTALTGFQEFIKRNPQTWWASVAREHVRRLQIG